MDSSAGSSRACRDCLRGAVANARAFSQRPALVTPTPRPAASATPFDCADLPVEKCEIERRMRSEQQSARDRWNAQAFRSYDPLPAIPFVASTPQPTARPATPTPEPSIRQCTALDLAGAYSGDNGAGGVTLRVVLIANTSATACGIRGKPSVRVLLANRSAEAEYADFADGPLAILPAGVQQPRPGEQPKPGQLWLTVGISRSCSFVSSRMSALLVILPGDGSMLRIDLPPRRSDQPAESPIPSASCSDAPYYPYIGTWALGVVEPPQPPALQSISELRVVANAPSIAVAGETLHFEVTISNESDTAVAFEQCPNYSVSIGGGGDRHAAERHVLNCASARELGPRLSTTFAMEVQVPGDWPVTLDGELSWSLDSYRAGLKLPLGIARRP